MILYYLRIALASLHMLAGAVVMLIGALVLVLYVYALTAREWLCKVAGRGY